MDTSRQIERPKDDFPCQVHRIPQILVVHTECDRVPPQRRDVLCVAHEYLRSMSLLGMRQAMCRQLMQFGARSEGRMNYGRGDCGEERGWQRWQECGEERGDVVCV